MLISLEEAEQRLASENNLINKLGLSNSLPESTNAGEEALEIIQKEGPGRTEGRKNLPSFLKEVIGVEAHLTTAAQVAESFDVSLSTVENCKHSRAGQDREKYKNEELKRAIDRNLGEIRDTAMQKLMMSLNLITEDKVNKASVRDISVISANLSKVVTHALPKEDKKDPLEEGAMKLIVYAPVIKTLNEYKVVEVDSGETQS